MTRLVFIAMLAIISLSVTAFQAAGAARATPPRPYPPLDHRDDDVCGGLDAPNLLQNPSFEGNYTAYIPPGGHQDCPTGICGTAQMAASWTPYWLSRLDTNNADIRMPEYKPAELSFVPPRVHHGARAQQYFTFHATHEAGFYQRVAVTPGQLYCFGIWGHAWSSSQDDPAMSHSELQQWIGVDPSGETDWESPNVIWGAPRQYYSEPGQDNAYGPFTLVVRAQSTHLTVYTKSQPSWPVKHNDVYWDDAILLRVPQEPALTVSRNVAAIIERPQDAAQYELRFDITFTPDPGLIWRAELQGDRTLDVSLTPIQGAGANDLLVSFDSAPYAPGVYTATILVTAHPAVPGSPQSILISLNIFEEIHETALPFIMN